MNTHLNQLTNKHQQHTFGPRKKNPDRIPFTLSFIIGNIFINDDGLVFYIPFEHYLSHIETTESDNERLCPMKRHTFMSRVLPLVGFEHRTLCFKNSRANHLPIQMFHGNFSKADKSKVNLQVCMAVSCLVGTWIWGQNSPLPVNKPTNSIIFRLSAWSTPQPLYNTIVGVQSINRVSYTTMLYTNNKKNA